MKTIISTSFLLSLCLNVLAQKFDKGLVSTISPDLICTNNYTSIALDNNKRELRFDKQNPYTYILLINDSQQQHYQLLYQTDFWGDLNFVGVGNNLIAFFECNNDNWTSYWNCNKRAASSVLKSVATEQQLNCIVERLNYCVEK
jgi:hypothetical protein